MIEALAMLGLMMMCVVVFAIMGSGYYNKVILNSTAQNMSLASQSILDRGCVPPFSGSPPVSGAPCLQAINDASDARNRIWNEAQLNLIGASNPSLVAEAHPGGHPGGWGTIPGTTTALGPGWGWTRIQLGVEFRPLLDSPLLIPRSPTPGCPAGVICQEARSLTVSYQEPQ